MGNSNSTSAVNSKTNEYNSDKTVQANFDRLVNAIKPAVGEVARKAYERNLITLQSVSDAENLMLPEDHRSSALLRQIQDKIEENETIFHVFISILRDVPLLRDLADDIDVQSSFSEIKSSSKTNGLDKKKHISCEVSVNCEISALTSQTEHDDSQHTHSSASDVSFNIERDVDLKRDSGRLHRQATNSVGETEESVLSLDPITSTNGSYQEGLSPCPSFQCRCGKNCTLDSFVKGKCHQQSRELFPYLKLEHLSRRDRDKLVRKLTSEAQTMVSIFADLVVDTFKSLEKQGISVEMLRADTITFGQQKLPKPYSDDHIQTLASASSVRDVQIFLVGYRYISFFNYGILQKMIRLYGTETDKSNFEDYLVKYSSFCKRSVFEVPSTMIDQLSPEIEESLVIKINEHTWFSSQGRRNGEVFTMEDLYAVEESIGKIIGLESTYILVRDIKEGCVELTFAFASDIKVLPLSLLEQMQLSSLGIRLSLKDSEEFLIGVLTQSHNLPTGSIDTLARSSFSGQDLYSIGGFTRNYSSGYESIPGYESIHADDAHSFDIHEHQCHIVPQLYELRNASGHTRNTAHPPPVWSRQTSISADNLPVLCLNDCPLVLETSDPAGHVSRPYAPHFRYQTVRQSCTRRSKSLSDLTPIIEVSEIPFDYSSHTPLKVSLICLSSITDKPVDYSYDCQESDSDDGIEADDHHCKKSLTHSKALGEPQVLTRGGSNSSGYESVTEITPVSDDSVQTMIRVMEHCKLKKHFSLPLPPLPRYMPRHCPLPYKKGSPFSLPLPPLPRYMPRRCPLPYETEVRSENGVTFLTTEC